jgi:hypothetical protein
MTAANRSTASPSAAPGRLSNLGLGSKLPSWLKAEEDSPSTIMARRRNLLSGQPQQRELVRIIVEDPEQWGKLHQAMKQNKSCTSMGLTQNLRFLIQDRIDDMESNGHISVARRRSLTE